MTGTPPTESDTFEGAWRAMYAWVKEMAARQELSLQLLETSIWIETPSGVPMYFYDARDRAWNDGIMDKIEAEYARRELGVKPASMD